MYGLKKILSFSPGCEETNFSLGVGLRTPSNLSRVTCPKRALNVKEYPQKRVYLLMEG